MALLTIEEAAKDTKLCRNTIKKAIKTGELLHAKFGRMVRIRQQDLDAWIATKIEVTTPVQAGSRVAMAYVQLTEKAMGGRQ